jgi:transposase
LSQILIDKYVDHLPIYRQIKRFERDGVKIPSSTIDSWQRLSSNLLDPLYECLKYHVLTEGYLQVDETPTPVLDKTKKGETHRGYHWVYHAPMQKAVFFDYQKGRGSEGPRALLKDFKGYLQVDGYGVYEWFGRQTGITLVGCMAHARRMFEKALDDNKVMAQHVLTQMQLLYSIERKAKEENYTPEERHQLRLEEALPVLNDLGKWMAEKAKTVLPKSPMSKALQYSIARWDNLLAYLHDGNLEIDNNLVENAIRPNALGRKNYLFAGSHDGAERIAMFYSFFGTCQKNNVEPFTWLKYVLEKLPDYPANRMKELLPQFIKF